MLRFPGVLAGLMAVLLFGTGPVTAGDRATIMVFDASGSMWNRMDGGVTRIEVARDVMQEFFAGRDASTPIAVIAYGHRRRGDCADIEVIAPLGLHDSRELAARVRALNPQGMTPLTDAVALARAQIPPYAEAADIILVTDGLETCGGDPCALAAELAAEGIPIRAHVVGFGMTVEEVNSLSCLPDRTGGQLFHAASGSELAAALSAVSVAEPAAVPAPAAAVPEDEPLPKASVSAPEEVVTGARFAVEWTGPNDGSDFITVVEAGSPEGASGNYARTRFGSPAQLTAPDALGAYEVRYVHQRSRKTLASQRVTLVPADAQLLAPERSLAGAAIEVVWQGPDNPNDYIAVVEPGAPEGTHISYARTRFGSPAKLTLPDALGDFELRYVIAQSGRTLASRPITLLPPSASLQAPEQAISGAAIEVVWEGPDNPNDYIAVVEAGAPEGTHISYARTRFGSPAKLTLPDALGSYELRYVIAQSRRTLASRPITLIPTTASLQAPEQAVAGAAIEVVWEGPDNPNDYIAVVEAGAPEGTHISYARTRFGSPAKLTLPDALGSYELRYVIAQSRRTLASRPIMLVAPSADLIAPDVIVPGGLVEVAWSGPDNRQDYITIVERGANEGARGEQWRTNRGSPARLRAPQAEGEYELRYVIGQSGRTLAALPVMVGAGEVSLAVEGTVRAGGVVTVSWQGPGRFQDFVQIVPEGSADAAPALREARASQGSPLQLFAPATPGRYELRYRASDSGEVLARIPLVVAD